MAIRAKWGSRSDNGTVRSTNPGAGGSPIFEGAKSTKSLALLSVSIEHGVVGCVAPGPRDQPRYGSCVMISVALPSPTVLSQGGDHELEEASQAPRGTSRVPPASRLGTLVPRRAVRRGSIRRRPAADDSLGVALDLDPGRPRDSPQRIIAEHPSPTTATPVPTHASSPGSLCF